MFRQNGGVAGDETRGRRALSAEEELMSRSSGFYPGDQCFYSPRTIGVRIPWGKCCF